MALKVGELEADITLDDGPFDKGLSRSETRFRSFAKDLALKGENAGKKAGVGIGSMAKFAGAGMAGMVVALGAAAPAIFDQAGQLELLGKKAKTVFGSELGRVDAWAKTSANAMGLTKREATGLAAGFADLLVPMGFTRKQAADMATDTVGLSGALSEWSGGAKSAAEVSDILSAAFLGERDGLQALGISVSQAEVDAALLAKGQEKLTGNARQQAEALATQKLIMEKSTDAQKAFADGAGSLARKSAESKAKVKEMSQELLVKATPALTGIANLVLTKVIPAVTQFGGYVEEHKYQIVNAFIEIGLGATGLVSTFGPALKWMDNMFLDFVGSLVNGAAEAFGWIPEIGPKLKAGQEKFEQYRRVHDTAFEGLINKSGEWNEALKKMQVEVKLKADISNWEAQLKTAKTQIADKNLTKERRAQLTADIKSLEAKIRTAKGQLADPALVATKVAQLEANKKVLDTKIAQAKTALKDPKLTAAKTAALKADIRQLLQAKKNAQAAIDALHGKTVNVTVNTYRNMIETGPGSTSVGVRAPGRALGGPVKKGRPYLVGERQPELFVPDEDGNIVPKVPPSARGTAYGSGSAPAAVQVQLEVHGGSTRFEQMFMDMIREHVKIRGGDVQKVLGR